MDKVCVVSIDDAEMTDVRFICKTKENAIKKLFELRDEIINEAKQRIEDAEEEDKDCIKDLYNATINNLLNDDWENWNNYPNEVPRIKEYDLLD